MLSPVPGPAGTILTGKIVRTELPVSLGDGHLREILGSFDRLGKTHLLLALEQWEPWKPTELLTRGGGAVKPGPMNFAWTPLLRMFMCP